MENIFILLMAGSGSRLFATLGMKKQFYPLQGKELFLYPLEAAIQSKLFSRYLIVADPEDIEKTKNIVEAKTALTADGYDVIGGGDSRNKSVDHALRFLKDKVTAGKVFIHDADRVLLTPDFLALLAKESLSADALTPVLPLTDSVLREKANDISYVDREDLYRVETPQVFSYPLMLTVYEKGYDPRDTDDFKKALRAGLSLKTVAGDPLLFKVTLPSDVVLLKALLEQKNKD